MPNVFRNLPSVGELLESPPLKSLIDRVNRNVVIGRVKQFLDDMQRQVRAAAAGMHVPAPAELALRIADWINTDRLPAIIPVINATGNILHPQLGGAPLPDEAIAELAALTRGYASFNMNLATGGDSAAVAAIERQLQRLTGAGAATITCSLASAAMVSLAAMAANREIIVARGEITAIDGNSRLPDLFQTSGAKLRETGTANVTRIDDYAAAITQQTAAILHLTASGFAVIGIAARPPLEELVSLARRSKLPLIHCLAQTSLLDLSPYGITDGSEVAKSVQCGADLMIFPGDGFIGGPPCGILVGRRSLIEAIEKHPLMPPVRAEKLTLAALGATLRLYEDQDVAERAIPVLSLLATPLENLRQRAERLAPQIAATGLTTVEIVAAKSYIAGHEVPGQSLPTVVLALSAKEGPAEQLAEALRTGAPSIVVTIDNDRLILDLRSVLPRDDLSLISAFTSLSRPTESQPTAPAVEL
ncbi:MAG TPA: L-seryl-tRNA(Sec) selenium transferase [Pirellulaceae bacterium]|jgi:L-seryl-tRNA(Ser) seleniumtransferase